MFIKLTKTGNPAETIYIEVANIVAVEGYRDHESYNTQTGEYERQPCTIIKGKHYDSFSVIEDVEVVMALILETQVQVMGARL